MSRKGSSNEDAPLNANFSEFTDLGIRQVEAYLEAQSALNDAVHEANSYWLRRLQNGAAQAADLVARLSSVRSPVEAASAWHEWTNAQSTVIADDIRRAVSDMQAIMRTATHFMPRGLDVSFYGRESGS